MNGDQYPHHQPTDRFDPDARFLLANERTLLAWIRTSLAIMAGGIVLTQLSQRTFIQVRFGIIAILFGALMTAVGYARFRSADRAIRVGELPDIGNGPLYQVIGVIVFAIVVAAIEIGRLG